MAAAVLLRIHNNQLDMVHAPRSSPSKLQACNLPSPGLELLNTGRPMNCRSYLNFASLLLALAPSDRTEHGEGQDWQELVMQASGNWHW
jgi:hypothetical protein